VLLSCALFEFMHVGLALGMRRQNMRGASGEFFTARDV
jgi:hypothetical protein